MIFHGTKKLSPIVSHDLWARNRKIVIYGISNPRACLAYIRDSSQTIDRRFHCVTCYA